MDSRDFARPVTRFARPLILSLCVALSGLVGWTGVIDVAGAVQQSTGSYRKRVNAGGPRFVDAAGKAWKRDRRFSSHRGYGFVKGRARRTSARIAGTRNDALYASSRRGNFKYKFDVDDGEYVVLLKFAEAARRRFGVGRRLFNVVAEGNTYFENLDIYAEAGANRALNKKISVIVNDGRLNVRFVRVIGGATLSAIEVVSAGSAAPGFALNVQPSSQTIVPGTNTSYTADLTYLNGFDTTEAWLSVSGLPAGVTGSFSPNPLTHEGRSILQLTTTDSAAPGTYAIRVTVTAEGITRSQRVSLVVSTLPDFALTVTPATRSVSREQTATYSVGIVAANGFDRSVSFSATGLPAGTTASFTPNPATPAQPVTATVATSQTTPLGTHSFTIRGTGGGLTRTVGAAVAVAGGGAGTWNAGTIGSTGSGNNSVIVGSARNDGVNRVYVGTVTTGRVWEFSRSGSQWTAANIGGNGSEVHNMGMGPGRNDGVQRIYAAAVDGDLLELSYENSQWIQRLVGPSSRGGVTHAVVGRARNDAVDRVYATRGPGVYEYTWTGSAWSEVVVGTVPSGIAHGISLGPGRNDGVNRLYIASSARGTFEATYANGSWSMVGMGDTGDVRNVSVGAGRNDGVQRVYAATRDGVIREFTRSSGNWTNTPINNSVGLMVHAYVVDGRNDGVVRVYGAAGNGNAYEFSWTGSGWDQVNLGGGSEYLYGFHFGRVGGATRLYGASFGSQVYEYSWQ